MPTKPSPLSSSASQRAPARWPALLFSLLLAGGALTGCGLLRGGDAQQPADERQGAIASDASERSGPDAFALEVQTDDAQVREYLSRHMQLQRFRHLPDLQDAELRRLLGAAEADVRALLSTLGYFSPEIAVALHDNPAPGAGARRDTPARTITVSVTPGQRTHIASAAVEVAGSGDPARPDGQGLARRQAQLQRGLGRQPGAPFTQNDWDDSKSQGLPQLQS
ncbi:MAG TPA: outer membrane protein assembly factor, partial [Comamonadaceae bacterium]|nr:outer membrane protein assembly factor [Comamonadaceae bacterium]